MTRRRQFKDDATGRFREGSKHSQRLAPLRGAVPHSEVLRVETTLRHHLPAAAYRNAFVTGRTRAAQRGLMDTPNDLWDFLAALLLRCDGGTRAVCKTFNIIKRDDMAVSNVGQRDGPPELIVDLRSGHSLDTATVVDHLRKSARAYVTIALDDMSEDEFNVMLQVAPVPAVLTGFLYHRVYMFVSKMEAPHAVILPAHRDSGSGPLVYAAGAPGGVTCAALTAPTNSEQPPDAFRTAFKDQPNDGLTDVHFTTLWRRGDFVCIPTQWWHTVMSEGARICVSYFDTTVDIT